MASSFRCAPCDESIPTAEALADHVRSVHGVDVGVEPNDRPAAPAEPVERLGRGTSEPDVADLQQRARSHGDTVDLLGTAVLWIGLGGALALAVDGAALAYAAGAALSAVVTWSLLKAAGILLALAATAANPTDADDASR